MTLSNANTGPSLPRATRRWRDVLLFGGLFALALIGLVGLAASTGWEEVKAQILRLSFAQFLALLGFSLINYILRGLRWHMFAHRLSLPIGILGSLRHFFGGFAMSVTPGRVGELVRMRWLRRETGWSFESTAPLALMDRASDLASMALLLGFSIALSTSGIAGAVPVTIFAFAAAIIATRPKLLAGIVTILFRLIGRWPRLFARFRAAAHSLKHFSQARLLLPATGLGLLGWVAEAYSFYLLLMWMGADVGLWMAAAIFIFSTLAGGLTGVPGGVGGAEAAMIALLSMEGVPLEVSLPATAIIRVTTLWFAIGLGLLIFPLAERHSLKVSHALENN